MPQEVENVTQDQQKELVISEDTETLQPKPKKKWIKWLIFAIAIIVAAIVVTAISVKNNIVDEQIRTNSINVVKHTTLEGYSKEVENAFNNCFGVGEWYAMYSRGSDICTVCFGARKNTTLDLGPAFKKGRYKTISTILVNFDLNVMTNKIKNIKVTTHSKEGDYSAYNSTEESQIILNGIFREDAYNAKLIRVFENQKNVLKKVFNELENNNISVAEAQRTLIENEIWGADFFAENDYNDKDKMLKLITDMIDAENSVIEKFEEELQW